MNNLSFLYPPSISYDFMKQRPQMMMKFLARAGYDTHFVNKEINLDGAINYKETTELEPRHYIHPSSVDINSLDWNTLYYTFPPPGMDIIKRKRPKYIVFDSVDDPTDGVFTFWNQGNAYYESLKRADLVLTTAKNLYDIAIEYNDNVLMSPNACDYDFLNTPQERPKEYLDIENPIILYSGAIATWLDTPLLLRSAKKYPEYTFVIVGASMNDVIHTRYDNVKILGHKPYATIPSYIQHADVCLIPFKPEQKEVQSCSPVKLPEYFACGKPVVSTAMPETRDSGDIFWSKTRKDFVTNIAKAYNNRNKKIKERQEFAQENSWNRRVADLLKRMEELK